MAEPMVPDWCSFFELEEYHAFYGAVDDALGMYGAEGGDIDGGCVEMAAGHFGEVYEFPLYALAVECRASEIQLWPDICGRQIVDWVEGESRRDWLTAAPFGAVEGLLRVWVTGEREVTYVGDPEGPEQPFAVRIADDLYVSLLADLPEYIDVAAIPQFVPNSAVRAWGLTAEELLDAARRRLRSLPPPVWEPTTVYLQDDQGRTGATGDVYVGRTRPDSDLPVSAWTLILDEVLPRPLGPDCTVAVPQRHLLVVGPPTDDATTGRGRVTAVRHHAGQAYRLAGEDDRVSCLTYRYRPPREFRSGRESAQAGSPPPTEDTMPYEHTAPGGGTAPGGELDGS